MAKQFSMACEATKEVFPYHTTLYENFFILRMLISFNDTPVTFERRDGGMIMRWSSSSDGVVSMESITA